MYTKKRFCFNKKPRPVIHPLKKQNSPVFIRKHLRCKYCAQEQNQKTKEFRSWSNKSGLLCLTFDETDLTPSPTFHNWFVANREGSSQWSNGVTEIKKFKVQVRNEGVFSYAIHITRSRVSFTLTYHVFNTYSREFHFLAWSRLNAVQAQITDRKIQDLRNEGPCQLTQMIVRWSSLRKDAGSNHEGDNKGQSTELPPCPVGSALHALSKAAGWHH